MSSLSLQSSAEKNPPVDSEQEIVRLEALLAERRGELIFLQEQLRAFKTLYTQIIGGRLAELAEVERAIKEAEKRTLGADASTADEDWQASGEARDDAQSEAAALPVKTTLRKLFWSVAKMFHPDHAADEGEARRRHTIMAEASRAYSEGDVESLHTLLGDDELRFICAGGAHGLDTEDDLLVRLLSIKEELRTVEFGIKRIRQDGLYRLKLSVDEEAARGRDALASQAESIDRKIRKARRRLEHLS